MDSRNLPSTISSSEAGVAPLSRAVGGVLLGMALLVVPVWPTLGDDISDTFHNLAPRDGGKAEADDTCRFCHTPLTTPVETGQAIDSAAHPVWQKALPDQYIYPSAEPVASQVLQNAGPYAGPNSLICFLCHDTAHAPFMGKAKQNHPISVPFGGWQGYDATGKVIEAPQDFRVWWVRPRANTTGSDYYKPAKEDASTSGAFQPAQSGLIGDQPSWWVSTTGSSRRLRSDLPLFTRAGPVGEEMPFVECASCHNPHATSRMFLRLSDDMGGFSPLCLSCHNM